MNMPQGRGSTETAEMLRGACVDAFIRARPRPRHQRAHPTYTLNCEKPS
jgi:hypothetical protein